MSIAILAAALGSSPYLQLVVLALVLALVYYIIGMFIQGKPLVIVGVLFAVILVIATLQLLGLLT